MSVRQWFASTEVVFHVCNALKMAVIKGGSSFMGKNMKDLNTEV